MRDPLPFLHMSYEQISLLTAQLLVYQQYLERNVAPSAKRNRTLRIVAALLRRFGAIVWQTNVQIALLTTEEVLIIKEALTVLQASLETKCPSAGRDQEIQRLAAMKMLIEQTFPLTQD